MNQESRTHRDQIAAAVRDYGSLNRSELPDMLRSPNPAKPQEFDLAMAVMLHQTAKDKAGPTYDDNGFLTGWYGIKLKGGRG